MCGRGEEVDIHRCIGIGIKYGVLDTGKDKEIREREKKCDGKRSGRRGVSKKVRNRS